jgi:tetratricopeptide (TPR) repeat protein
MTEIRAMTNLGAAHYYQARLDDAINVARGAADLALREGYEVAAAIAHGNAALYLFRRGRMAEAYECLTVAEEIWSRTDNVFAVETLSNLVEIHCRYGRLDEAMRMAQRAVVLTGETRSPMFRGGALADRGLVFLVKGDFDAALADLCQARALFGGFRQRMTRVLSRIGEVRRRQQRYDEAAERHEEALALLGAGSYDMNTIEISTRLAAVRLDQGRLDEAFDRYSQAYTFGQTVGLAFEHFDAAVGLARVHEARGEADAAATRWREALDLAEQLDLPDADDIRRQWTVAAESVIRQRSTVSESG